MPQTSVATGTFPSRKAANQAVDRLVADGFARNSIELHRHDEDEGYDLEIHTRAENLKRAKRLMQSSSSFMSMRGMEQGVGQVASGAVQTARSHPLLVLGAGLLAGFVLYNLIPRSAAHEPSREPARRKPQARSGQRAKRTHRS